MRPQYILSLFALVVLNIAACNKDDEPFEYPDDEITQPEIVNHMVREMDVATNWTLAYDAQGCDEAFPIETYAQNVHDTSKGFISIFLTPNSDACDLYVEASTDFKASEIPSDYWETWKFEFAFSELSLNDSSELHLVFDYREVQLNLDLAPFMRELFTQGDTLFIDTDGLFTLEFQEGFANFYLNGVNWKPDFSAESGNAFSKEASVDNPRFELRMAQAGTEDRSLIVFNYLRVSSYGVPEQ